MDISVNYLAIFIAGVVATAIGFLWYSPFMFAKPWMKLMGYTADSIKKAQKEMGPWYGVSMLLSFLTAFVLSHVMALSQNFYNYSPVMTGVITAFWMWLGFVMPVQATDVIFGGKKWKLFGINTGYQLATLLAMGIVLGLM